VRPVRQAAGIARIRQRVGCPHARDQNLDAPTGQRLVSPPGDAARQLSYLPFLGLQLLYALCGCQPFPAGDGQRGVAFIAQHPVDHPHRRQGVVPAFAIGRRLLQAVVQALLEGRRHLPRRWNPDLRGQHADAQ
jgi:hypothetical protein